jgi:hypothetical protein
LSWEGILEGEIGVGKEGREEEEYWDEERSRRIELGWEERRKR